jgi:transposase-like protein
MKMTRYSASQILAILHQAEGGVPVSELCREHGMHGPAEYCETMFERGATRRSTNGGQSMAGWMRG